MTTTATLLFCDIEGSTKLWESRPQEMGLALARHDEIVRASVESNGGRIFKNVGDGFHCIFFDPRCAAAAARDAQLALAREEWPEGVAVKVRMAVHTGAVEERGDDVFGPPVRRVASLLSAGHGAQVLASRASVTALGTLPNGLSLRDMGERRLKDLDVTEQVFQLTVEGVPANFPPLRTLDQRANNLPVQITSFVGRQEEMSRVRALLREARLVTLTGSGGSGKSRLALQVAADLLDDFADGVWVVELAPVADGRLLAQATASVLGLTEEPGVPFEDALVRYLRSKAALVLFDNCEHVVDACAALAQRLLHTCPEVRLLVTSRESMRMAEETTYRVPSLATPDPESDTTVEALAPYETVRLFLERAEQVRSGFSFTDESAPALAQICHRLDGIPLAIELAAARVRSMSVDEVNRRLDDRFRLLTGGSRTALPRQQTLRSLIDWSYDLLDEQERALLARLGVFAGGWSLEAAESVCSGSIVEDWEVVNLLTSLTDKSLMIADATGHDARYRLLQTVRQYALDALGGQGDAAVWMDRHMAYFVSFVEEAEPQLTGSQQSEWMSRLDADLNNIRAALARALQKDGSLALRLCAATRRLWSTRGHYKEGRSWFGQALEMTQREGVSPERAAALQGAGALAYVQGEFQVARRHFEEGKAAFTALGDRRGMAAAGCSIGVVTVEQGDHAAAKDLFLESLEVMEELGDKLGVAVAVCNLGVAMSELGEWDEALSCHERGLAVQTELGDRNGIAYTLNNLGMVSRLRGDLRAAREYFEQSIALRREVGDRPGTAYSLANLTSLCCDLGDLDAAETACREALKTLVAVDDHRGLAMALSAAACLLSAKGDHQHAAEMWGAAERQRSDLGLKVSASDQSVTDPWMGAARKAMGVSEFDAALAKGRSLTIESVIALAEG
ncbi:MAG: tetratricopeptide repeat protein [Armatimonadetes bacterium]|nr:tetratricopeptide repeat protein [Armatimonadota bacterium]